jgi:hypothetical protein
VDDKALQALAAALWAGDDVDTADLTDTDRARVEALLALWVERELRAAAAEADGDDGDDGMDSDDDGVDSDDVSPWPWE